MSLAFITRRSAPGLCRSMVRFESSATQKASQAAKDTTAKAQNTASEYQARASQGLSLVASTAGPAVVNAIKGASGALSRVGGRTGRLFAFVERQAPFVLYYSRVGLELAKLVFKGQNMSPPSISTFQSYFQNIWKQLQHPSQLFSSANFSSAIHAMRNMSRTQLISGAILLAEILGFFTVGEIIGRFKLIGYHSEADHGHH